MSQFQPDPPHGDASGVPRPVPLPASREEIIRALPEVIGHLMDTKDDVAGRYKVTQLADLPTTAYYGAALAVIHEMTKALAQTSDCRPLDIFVRLASHMPEVMT